MEVHWAHPGSHRGARKANTEAVADHPGPTGLVGLGEHQRPHRLAAEAGAPCPLGEGLEAGLLVQEAPVGREGDSAGMKVVLSSRPEVARWRFPGAVDHLANGRSLTTCYCAGDAEVL